MLLLSSPCAAGLRADASLLVLRCLRCVGHAQGGQAPLHLAAYYGRVSVVTLLVECGADLNAKDCVRHATRPHHCCSSTLCCTHAATRARSWRVWRWGLQGSARALQCACSARGRMRYGTISTRRHGSGLGGNAEHISRQLLPRA
jgi:hypothetical protein